jgi:hypothetical protein
MVRHQNAGIKITRALLGVWFIGTKCKQTGVRGALSVRASRPTARPAHAAPHFIEANLNSPLPCGVFLRRRDPADPLISGHGSDLRPKAFRRGVRLDGFSEVCWQPMHRAACKSLSCHASKRWCFAQRAEPRRNDDDNRESGTERANRHWLQRFVSPRTHT